MLGAMRTVPVAKLITYGIARSAVKSKQRLNQRFSQFKTPPVVVVSSVVDSSVVELDIVVIGGVVGGLVAVVVLDGVVGGDDGEPVVVEVPASKLQRLNQRLLQPKPSAESLLLSPPRTRNPATMSVASDARMSPRMRFAGLNLLNAFPF